MKFINLGSMNNKLHIAILFMHSGGCRINRHAARPSALKAEIRVAWEVVNKNFDLELIFGKVLFV